MKALNLSLKNILDENLSTRVMRHYQMRSLVRQGLMNLGFELLVASEREAMSAVTVAKSHPRLAAGSLIRYLKEEQRILIGGGLQRLASQIFRIGYMGSTATREALAPTLLAIEDALRAAGVAIASG